jgi:hypothetical protein
MNTRRLVPYPSNSKSLCDYMALSYVWGDSKPCIEKFGEIPKVLPRTISDSIKVVKELGKNYLWVDSICINQFNLSQKMTQIDIMDTIYECAFATIIALDGKHADDGLAGVGNHARRTQQLFAEFGKNRMIDKLPSLCDQLEQSPCAWTYQEGLLSKRRLIFAKHQLYFSCNEMECCESLNDKTNFGSLKPQDETDIPHYVKDPFLDPSLQYQPYRQKLRLYEDIVNNYRKRKLSRDDDSLNAISALLRSMQRVMPTEGFLYGLPLADLRTSLLWRQRDSAGAMKNGFHGSLNHTTRRGASNIPSWSWAAWNLPQKIRMPRIRLSSARPIQPPLTVGTSEGKDIDVAEKPMDECQSQLQLEELEDEEEETMKEKEKVLQIISATRAFYDQLETKTTRHVTVLPEQIIGTSIGCCLLIEGILLNFPCTVGPYHGVRWSSEKPVPVPSLVLPNDLNDEGNVYVFWQNDGYIDKIIQPGDDESRHDFLLVSALADGYSGLELELLHLYWEGGVAFRGGVVSISINSGKVAIFWQECNATRRRFWFG